MGIISTEYFIGLELLRFFLLWVFLKDKHEHAFRAALIRWLPYIGLVLAFSIWRIFFAEITYPQPLLMGDFKLDASGALKTLLYRIPADLWTSSGPAWWKPFLLQNINLDPCIYIGTGIALSALIWLFLRDSNSGNSKENTKSSLLLTGTGFAVMLVSGLPLWISKTQLALNFPENRAALCLMVGGCMTLAGFVSLLRHTGQVIMSILLGFSLIFQLDTCLGYTQNWEQMNAFFIQLTACAPGLEPGTVILYEEPFIPSYPANSLSALLNWTYDPENHTNSLSYDMLRISERLGNSIPAFKPDLPIQHGAFHDSTSQALVITLDKDNCLHFIYPDSKNTAVITQLLRQASSISNSSVIISNPAKSARPPAFISSASTIEKCVCE